MESNVNGNEKVEPSDFEKTKSHFVKHKKKYIFGGIAAVSFIVGFSLGNRGNSKRHYSKLLKDGVKDAVKEGMKDVVHEGMKDVVEDGMRRVVTYAVNNAFEDAVTDIVDEVGDTVKDTVKKTIKESAVTILREVEVKSDEDKNTDAFKKILDLIKEEKKDLKFHYDSDGNVYSTKS